PPPALALDDRRVGDVDLEDDVAVRAALEAARARPFLGERARARDVGVLAQPLALDRLLVLDRGAVVDDHGVECAKPTARGTGLGAAAPVRRRTPTPRRPLRARRAASSARPRR